jgi:hypothetical protein
MVPASPDADPEAETMTVEEAVAYALGADSPYPTAK